MSSALQFDRTYADPLSAELRSKILRSIQDLDDEIARICHSQETMREASRALLAGREVALRSMNFSEEHIQDLARRVEAGEAAFPEYVYRNNANLVRNLRKKQFSLLEQLRELDRSESIAAVSAAVERTPYWCDADNPAMVPFLSRFLPFIR